MLFLFIISFSALVQARTMVFNDQIRSGENIDIDDFTFIITMNKYASAIFVDAGTMYQSVQLFGCENMESFTICFKNTTYDEEENELFAEINITRAEPDVTVTRIMNQTEMYVGQEAEVTITIKNIGDTAPNIIMTDDYPASIEIYDMYGGCNVHENQVYWQGHLDQDEEKVCTFLIKPTKELHQSLVAHLKYWDHYKWVDDYSVTMTIDVEPVLEIFSSIVREDYEVDGTTFDFEEDNPWINIGETLRLIINITNNYDDYVDVSAMEVTLPPNLEYKSVGNLRFNYINASGNRSSMIWSSDRIRKIGDSMLRWDGRINEGKSKLFIIKLQAKRTGDQNLMVRTDYEYDELGFSETGYENFVVADPGIAIRMTFEDQSRLFSAPVRLDDNDETDEEDNIEIEARHPYKVTVYTQNINKYSVLNDVKMHVYTELAGFKDVRYPEMAEEGQKIPYSFVLMPPHVDASKEFKTNVSIEFRNEFGETHYNSSEFRITVVPSKDLIIEWDSSEGTAIESGVETEIKVSITNDRLIDLRDVQVTDTIPSDFHVEGVHAKRVKLNKEEDTEVYTYRIIPPILHNKTRYTITTTVTYFDPDLRQTLNVSENNTITVEPLKPDISVDLTIEEPDPIYPGTLIPAEYTIINDEEEELVRHITVHFPIQGDMDLVGPRTFFIDKLDPGEEIVIPKLVKFRPKVIDRNFQVVRARAEYYDDYGNIFEENSTEESFEVEDARINGPAIFLRTIVPEVINKSTDALVKIEVRNNGSAAADLTVEQGNSIWNITVAAESVHTIAYPVRYDTEGNYTIPDPYATFTFQGLEAHTKGNGTEAHVKLLLGPEEEVVEKEAPPQVIEEPEPEKVEMSFEEYEEQQAAKQMRMMIRYGTVGFIAIIVLITIAAYINYQRKKGPSAPFMESEEK